MAGLMSVPLIGKTAFAAEKDSASKRLPILQGLTDETRAQFRVLVPTAKTISYRVLDSSGSEVPCDKLDRFIHPGSPRDAMEHLQASGLQIGIDYRLQAIEAATGAVLDERLFRALDTKAASGRFAIVSCMNDWYSSSQADMWQSLAKASPSVVFFIGDSCYADVGSDGTEGGLWRRYMETRRLLQCFKWPRLIPILAAWDDHDYGANGGDKTFRLGESMRSLFAAALGSNAQSGLHEKGPGVASVTSLFGQRFFLMDDRSFRDPVGTSNGMQWGSEQEEWLMAKIAESEEPAWIMNGSQFFGGYLDKDAFETHHIAQLKRVLQRMSKSQAPVVFASGDVHFSELMTLEPALLGYQTYELTSSSMHSLNLPWQTIRYTNPRRITSTGKHNFLLVESSGDRSGLDIRVTSLGAGRAEYFKESLAVHR